MNKLRQARSAVRNTDNLMAVFIRGAELTSGSSRNVIRPICFWRRSCAISRVPSRQLDRAERKVLFYRRPLFLVINGAKNQRNRHSRRARPEMSKRGTFATIFAVTCSILPQTLLAKANIFDSLDYVRRWNVSRPGVSYRTSPSAKRNPGALMAYAAMARSIRHQTEGHQLRPSAAVAPGLQWATSRKMN